MSYEAWRATFQSAEQAAKAAYETGVRQHQRAEKAERERDELAAIAKNAIQAARRLSAANNETEADEATEIIDMLESQELSGALAALRAKHWRECANNLQAIIDFIDEKHDENPNYPMVCYDAISEYVQDILRGADNIERGEG